MLLSSFLKPSSRWSWPSNATSRSSKHTKWLQKAATTGLTFFATCLKKMSIHHRSKLQISSGLWSLGTTHANGPLLSQETKPLLVDREKSLLGVNPQLATPWSEIWLLSCQFRLRGWPRSWKTQSCSSRARRTSCTYLRDLAWATRYWTRERSTSKWHWRCEWRNAKAIYW